MLQALTTSGKLVIPAILSRQEMQHLRKNGPYYCPECGMKVIFRAGTKVIPHFAHQQSLSCSKKGGESLYHMKGKLQIYQWLRSQYKDVYLEAFLPEIKQRPDILLKIAHRTIAVEMQCSVIDPKIIQERNKGYQNMGITPIWLLGANNFKRIGKQKIKVNSFMMETLQKFSAHTSTQLIYYCPKTHQFSKANDLHLITNHHAIAHLTYYKTHQITFPQLLLNENINKQNLLSAWLLEKKRLRLGYNKIYGRELKWRQWLYEKGFYIEHLPGIVHLPVATQYLMKVPVWHWQSKFLIDFLHPLPVQGVFSLYEVNRFLRSFTKNIPVSSLIKTQDSAGLDYLKMLVTLGYVKELKPNTFCKVQDIFFPSHIEQALQIDRKVLRKLLENEAQMI